MTPAPECADYTAELSLSATDVQLDVGDVVTVTVMLTNQGCGLLGLPRYALHGGTEGDQTFFQGMPEAVVHFAGIATGQSDAVEFALRAVAPGEATLLAGASFEFHAGYPGPAYWRSAGSGPLQITILPEVQRVGRARPRDELDSDRHPHREPRDVTSCHRTVTRCFTAVTRPPYPDNTGVIGYL